MLDFIIYIAPIVLFLIVWGWTFGAIYIGVYSFGNENFSWSVYSCIAIAILLTNIIFGFIMRNHLVELDFNGVSNNYIDPETAEMQAEY
jgi:hypothetical protein